MTTEKKYPIPTLEQEDIEEALSSIWQYAYEKNIQDSKTLIPILTEAVDEKIILTPEGETLGRDVTRRHRLAERLLSDVLAIAHHAIDPNACQLEHILSAEVTESICKLLGHPQQCPHGTPIPPGACCHQSSQTIEPIICSLDKLQAGAKAKVAYLSLSNHPDLHKLLSLGLIPGTLFNLHQTFPTYVLEIGETTLALEKEIAEKIFVRHMDF